MNTALSLRAEWRGVATLGLSSGVGDSGIANSINPCGGDGRRNERQGICRGWHFARRYLMMS